VQERGVDGRQPVEVVLRHAAILPVVPFHTRLVSCQARFEPRSWTIETARPFLN
jgi:hypothetical protein